MLSLSLCLIYYYALSAPLFAGRLTDDRSNELRERTDETRETKANAGSKAKIGECSSSRRTKAGERDEQVISVEERLQDPVTRYKTGWMREKEEDGKKSGKNQ